MKITRHTTSVNQCSHCTSAAMRVTAGCRFSSFTAGPPGRLLVANTAGAVSAAASAAPQAAARRRSVLVVDFFVMGSLQVVIPVRSGRAQAAAGSEEHTSELQSPKDLVC